MPVTEMTVAQVLQMSPVLVTAFAFFFGLVIGSFLNVVVHRLPLMMERDWRRQCEELAEEDRARTAAVKNAGGAAARAATAARQADKPFNLVVPRSRCPSCGTQIRAAHNIPLLSFLLLRGRCAHCKAKISLRYPVVELLTGVLSAAVAWHFGFGWPALAALVFTWTLIALA